MPNQPFRTIVVPIDYTETSLKALTVAIRFGQEQQASVHLVYVTDPNGPEPAAVNRFASEPTGNWAQAKAEGNALIQALAMQIARQHRIRCSATFRIGSLTEEVVTAAHEAGANLIVVGTRPGNDLIALRRATSAYQLVEMAPCPVLAIPAQQEWSFFERILFPVRPVPGALDKYVAVRQLLPSTGAELLVLALFSPDEVISRYQLEEDISLLKGKLGQDGVKSRTEFCPTDLMAETVLGKAIDYQADLLVITAGPGTGSDAFFTGSFARQMLRNAPLPVLAIRPELTLHSPGARVVWQYGLPDSDQSVMGL